MRVIIGYQGIVGSNSEEAAKRFAIKLGIEDAELMPLVSSKNVMEKLKRDEIDYGVVAIKNSIGGIVQETYEAMKYIDTELVGEEVLPIHHCLFVKNIDITEDKINKISSHPQALVQCKNNIAKYIGEVDLEEIEDTAIGAKYLYEGKLSESTGVLCRKNAGEKYNLHLLYENIEDRNDNETEFRMFKKA